MRVMSERFLAALHADAEGFLSAYTARFGNVLNAERSHVLRRLRPEVVTKGAESRPVEQSKPE
jgi:hypothetical protein